MPNPPIHPGTSHRLPFLVRAAGAQDRDVIRAWLPDVLGGTPAAQLTIATDAATEAIAGVAALRVYDDRVGRFHLHVDPASRRRGCGTALLERIQESATRAGVRSLMTGQSYEVAAEDDASRIAQAFLQSRGLAVAQAIVRSRAEFKSVLPALEPIYQRLAQRLGQTARIVPAAQVDPQALAAFVVAHIGGLPEAVAGRLQGRGPAYSLTISMVALVNGAIAGVLLAQTQGQNVCVEARAVAAGHRGGGLNLALMVRATQAAAAQGIQTVEFEHDTKESDTAKLARRLGATPIGCRQCWGVTLPERERAGPVALPPPRIGNGRATPGPALAARHTTNFPELLRQLGASLLLTTYQAGKLVLVRDEGDHRNAHCRGFDSPMGMALDGDRLAIGTRTQVWEFVNVPAVAARLAPPGRHDACYLPRSSHFTGDIQIHEMAWANPEVRSQKSEVKSQGTGTSLTSDLCPLTSELWVVNTRFSCLCTLDRSASFRPRWRPPFVSELEPSDRCHLNGLAMVELDFTKGVTSLREAIASAKLCPTVRSPSTRASSQAINSSFLLSASSR